ncbi:small-conductance mechanosensitive channel [Bacillus sp. SLBN-46]|jgi:hypothetical protein|uniref:hypothetical protein n=1 Tax=Bacillus sp. SLBN-46 TaxID=3042283 RepID=UPI002854EA17|nr:hypothetical protein [Bacillus sp. SLBN-46]MDR6121527.1 small-conductance mechanosensitive channel [Bacillus sp. SLBN-46]
MNLKKGLAVGIGALLLLGGTYQIQSAYAAENPQTVEAKESKALAGKKFEKLEKYQEQIHQVNQLREERLDLKKQMVEKKDQLVDLFVAAKKSGNKEALKQVKESKKQLKTKNGELNALITKGKDERKVLKEAVKTGDATEQFDKVIAAQKQVNEILKEQLALLDQMIAGLK